MEIDDEPESLTCRKLHDEAGRLRRRQDDRPTVPFDDLPGDGEPEPRSSCITRPCGVEAGEPVEDVLAVGSRHARAVVAHREPRHPVVCLLERERDGARGMPDGIRDEVPHRPSEQRRIARNLHRRHCAHVHVWERAFGGTPSLAEHDVIEIDDVADQLDLFGAGVGACRGG